MIRTALRLFGAVALTVGLAMPAAAIVYDVPTDEAFVDRSPLIVQGTVEWTNLAPDGESTDALVRVERVLKGFIPGSAVIVRQHGGGGTLVMGLPMLREGDRVLLFLAPGRDGVWRTVDMGLGIFFEDRGHLVRHHVEERRVRQAERFGRWIEDRRDGLVRPSDYGVEKIPGPQGVLQEARWRTADNPGCEATSGTPILLRWAQWDHGFSPVRKREIPRYEGEKIREGRGEPDLHVAVIAWKGSSDWAINMTQSAAAWWNGDSGSRVQIPAGHPYTRAHSGLIDASILVQYGGGTPGCNVRQVRMTYDYDGEKPCFSTSERIKGRRSLSSCTTRTARRLMTRRTRTGA